MLGALTGLKLEWKSPPRGAEAVSWLDASRRMGSLTLMPLVASLGLLRLRAAFVALVPMLLPLSLAVPFTVLTGHPRAGRAVARLGLLRTPEEWRPTRLLVRASDRHSFIDLVPAPVTRHRAHLGAPATGPAPGLGQLDDGRGGACDDGAAIGHRARTVARDPCRDRRAGLARRAGGGGVLTEPMLPLIGEAPARKRVAAREKPARMIDDALRQRALEAVRDLIIHQSPPV